MLSVVPAGWLVGDNRILLSKTEGGAGQGRWGGFNAEKKQPFVANRNSFNDGSVVP